MFICFLVKSQDSTNAIIVKKDVFETKSLIKENIKIDKNVLKWNIYMLGRGAFIINYERMITSQFTIETGLGLTYRDFILEDKLLHFSSNSDGEEKGSKYVHEFFGIETKINLGYSIEVAPRFYPKDGDFEGYYISTPIRFRQYNIENKYDFSYNTLDFGFVLGYQYEQWGEILSDYYIGVGYRTNHYSKFDTNNLQTVATKESYPCLFLGYKLGFSY